MQLLYCQRNGCNLLHEFCTDLVGDRAAARARYEHPCIVGIDAGVGSHALQEFQGLFWLLGLVSLIILPQHSVACGVNDYSLHGR